MPAEWPPALTPLFAPHTVSTLGALPACPPPSAPQVEFRLLGFIPGSVGLRGRFVSIPEREGGEDRKDTVKVGRAVQ